MIMSLFYALVNIYIEYVMMFQKKKKLQIK